MQPVMKQFDFAWTLDTDGYYPAPLNTDYMQVMHDENKIYAYSHTSRDQPSAVQHFWELTRGYLEHKNITVMDTPTLRHLTDALVMRDTFWNEWNRVLFMNDVEIVRLSWFRNDPYQDFFNYIDSLGGWWLYRWGDHGVRTLAVAFWVDKEDYFQMKIPYGHQNVCHCGDEHPNQVCKRFGEKKWWRCVDPKVGDKKVDPQHRPDLWFRCRECEGLARYKDEKAEETL